MSRILFVTESPSSSSKSFYNKNSPLFRAMKVAFEEVFGNFADDNEFLIFFQDLGCRLIYLIPKPFKKDNKMKRDELRRDNVSHLGQLLKHHNPQYIVVVMKALDQFVNQAVEISGGNTLREIISVPFPAMSERNRLQCIQGIKEFFKESIL